MSHLILKETLISLKKRLYPTKSTDYKRLSLLPYKYYLSFTFFAVLEDFDIRLDILIKLKVWQRQIYFIFEYQTGSKCNDFTR